MSFKPPSVGGSVQPNEIDLDDGDFLVGNVSNKAAGVTPTGDVTFNNTGVFAIGAGVIVDADINASAAIATTKLADGSTFVTSVAAIVNDEITRGDSGGQGIQGTEANSGADVLYKMKNNATGANSSVTLDLITSTSDGAFGRLTTNRVNSSNATTSLHNRNGGALNEHIRLDSGFIRNLLGIRVDHQDLSASGNTDGHTYVHFTGTAGGTVTILTTNIAEDGFVIIIMDVGGNAGTNNITIATQGAETIDGNATVTISADNGVVRLQSDGSNLFGW